jgi:hypothetical protein
MYRLLEPGEVRKIGDQELCADNRWCNISPFLVGSKVGEREKPTRRLLDASDLDSIPSKVIKSHFKRMRADATAVSAITKLCQSVEDDKSKREIKYRIIEPESRRVELMREIAQS